MSLGVFEVHMEIAALETLKVKTTQVQEDDSTSPVQWIYKWYRGSKYPMELVEARESWLGHHGYQKK